MTSPTVLMALSSSAVIPNLDKSNKEVMALDFLQAQMTDLKMMMEMIMQDGRRANAKRNSIAAIEYERIVNKLEKLNQGKLDLPTADREYSKLLHDTEEIMMNCGNESDHHMFRYLIEKIHRQREEFFSTR